LGLRFFRFEKNDSDHRSGGIRLRENGPLSVPETTSLPVHQDSAGVGALIKEQDYRTGVLFGNLKEQKDEARVIRLAQVRKMR
jgi:hypothetical protein